jgi:hypothetical protein
MQVNVVDSVDQTQPNPKYKIYTFYFYRQSYSILDMMTVCLGHGIIT